MPSETPPPGARKTPVRVLEVDDLVAGYGDVAVLHGVRASVAAGEVLGVIGPNGAGKSTLAKAILGLADVRAGHIRLKGQDLAGLRTHEVIAAGVGYVPQLKNVFPSMTVRENLEVGAFLRHEGVDEAIGRVEAIFPLLRDRTAQKVGRMSGGERQMVAMGRALVTDPTLLVLDEPSAGLAPTLQDAVFDRVRDVARTGVAVLLVEQNARKALRRCDRAIVLDQGKNAFEGSGPQVLAHPEIGKLYLGR